MDEEKVISTSSGGGGSGTVAPSTRLSVIRNATKDALEQIAEEHLSNPEYVEGVVLHAVHDALDLENSIREKGDKWKQLNELMPAQIADILAYSYPIVRIAGADLSVDGSQDMIAIYQYDGVNKGIYVTDETEIRKLVRRYNYGIKVRDMNEVIGALLEELPRITVCKEPNFVAVNNGIFDFDKKELIPFSPEYVFLSKSRVNYNSQAKNVVIHNNDDNSDWNIESWMSELTDDPEITQLLWEILGAVIRPLVPWDKSAWFYSETGNNGKGSYCELARNVSGEGSYASITLSDFSKDFALEPLLRTTAIIVDENDVGTYIDKAANLKAVITGDVIQINRKFKTPIAFRSNAFMIQCLNEMPKIKDRSNSFYRRQLFVPFTKCFTGHERKYIKHDYFKRQDVLEYVLYRVLNMNYYELSTPKACELALEEYKAFNDPVIDFMNTLNDFFPYGSGFRDFEKIPCKLLHSMYLQWDISENNSQSQLLFQTFNSRVSSWVDRHSDEWLFSKEKFRISKLKNVDTRIFKNFPADSKWLSSNGETVFYTPKVTDGKSYLQYIGTVPEDDETLEKMQKKLDELGKSDALYQEYLIGRTAEEKDCSLVAYSYSQTFNDWLLNCGYRITPERDNISMLQIKIDEIIQKKG